MARAIDVADYILQTLGELTAMKLQKLCYYGQAWSLVWDEKPLFPSTIQAWANGPVSPELYSRHRGEFKIGPGFFGGDPNALTESEKATLDAVIEHYGHLSAVQLSEMTHRERPWLEARGSTPPGERSDAEITQSAMAEYYGSLV